MAIERYTSALMDTCLMQKQAAVKNKSMTPALRKHLTHVKEKEMAHMQTTAPAAKITTGICIFSYLCTS
jgi:hypothetical protein